MNSIAFITEVHSGEPNRILNHFLFMFFRDIFLYSQMDRKGQKNHSFRGNYFTDQGLITSREKIDGC
jgi:hypothetical protein